MNVFNTVASATPKLLGALSLVAGLTISATAQAAPVIDLGTLAEGTTTYSAIHQNKFSDDFKFTLGNASDLGTKTENKKVSFFGLFDLVNIKNLSFSLYSDAAHTHLIGLGLDHSFTSLSAGNYFANISGKANGALFHSGEYKLSLNVSSLTPPVPEAETYAMLLAGLGVIGAISRRRQQKTSTFLA
ncbi:MAG: FxDxF family PEP-CTERM protein [Burkholderiales bacterium]|nr:FxDxF family PEP-CTERM protein [Burkholderiales bacterium]